MAGVELVMVFAVASFNLAVVPWGIGADQLVANTEFCSGRLEQGGLVL